MTTPQEVMALFGSYGALVDERARGFLKRGSYDMYGMMRYFMGYADESFRETKEVFGGKRFRSGLLLLIADLYGAKEQALPAALSVELFHNFTLIHDDIVDRDELRRGRPTVWKLYGTDHAINTGDAQFILSMLALEDLDPDIRAGVRTFLLERYLEVSEGQYLDFSLTSYALNDSRITESTYLEMLEKKTSVLVGAATKAAGKVAHVEGKEEELLWRYGLALGLAYQLCDDAVSIWGTKDMTGKQPHGDIREKKKTMPVLYAYNKLPPSLRDELVALYREPESLSDSSVRRVIELLDSVDSYAYTRTRINEYRDRALEAAKSLCLEEEKKKILYDVVSVLLPDVKKSS